MNIFQCKKPWNVRYLKLAQVKHSLIGKGLTLFIRQREFSNNVVSTYEKSWVKIKDNVLKKKKDGLLKAA